MKTTLFLLAAPLLALGQINDSSSFVPTEQSSLASSTASTLSGLASSILAASSTAATLTPFTSSSDTTTSATSTLGSASTQTQSSSPGLAPGAYAGIGVGATLAVVVAAAVVFFLFRKHRRNLKNRNTTFHPRNDHLNVSSFSDPTGKSELQGDLGRKQGFTSTIQQKPEMQTLSNRHEAEGPGVLATSTSTDRRHELHEEAVNYQRNGESDTTAYDEGTGSNDRRWGGGPGAATSEGRTEG